MFDPWILILPKQQHLISINNYAKFDKDTLNYKQDRQENKSIIDNS